MENKNETQQPVHLTAILKSVGQNTIIGTVSQMAAEGKIKSGRKHIVTLMCHIRDISALAHKEGITVDEKVMALHQELEQAQSIASAFGASHDSIFDVAITQEQQISMVKYVEALVDAQHKEADEKEVLLDSLDH